MATQNNSDKPAVFLLDSMSFIFRAYHAMQRQRPMSTRTGVPTAATYVFVNMIKKLRQDFSPHYFAAVFDVSGPVFRDERAKDMGTLRRWNAKKQAFDEIEYAGYKANREEMPADLAQQLPYIRRALEAFRIPILQAEGFEADDVIGTLAHKAAAQGYPVFVVSNDKDMMQLVTDNVKILNPVKENLILDPAKVEETLGVPPAKVIDVMALRGDAIDNIPGAPGIGDKGSVELIRQFGSLEATLDRAEEVKRKTYRESLQKNRENILLSKELVTIDQNVPLELNLGDMLTQPPNIEACRELFTELEFTSLLKELGPSENPDEVQYILHPTPEETAAFLAHAKTSGFAFALNPATVTPTDTESESFEEAEPVPAATLQLNFLDTPEPTAKPTPAVEEILPETIFGAAAEDASALILPLATLRPLLEDETIPKRVHDLKSILHTLAPLGITLRGVTDDVMLYSYLINPTHTTHRLADVTARFRNYPLETTGENALPQAAHAIFTLAPTLRADVEREQTLSVYEDIDLPLTPVLFAMEEAGVRIDTTVLNLMGDRLAAEMQRLSEEIFTLSQHRFNINSPKQLGDVLFNKMSLPKPLKHGKGKVVSTAQDVLEDLALHNPVPRLVLEYRQLAKLKSTYIDSLPLLADANGRVHTTFQQVGTATGRLSSTNPNLQNIPVRTELGREIRAAFIAAPGRVLLAADYSQIELRLMAHFSEDPLLLRAYTTGQDIHTLTASEVFGVPPDQMDKQTRNRAKAVNFGIVYGISPFGLAQNLGIEQSEARQYIDTYFARYKGVRAYIDRVIEETRRDQKVRTLFGRVRPIPDIQSRNANQRGFAERTAVNTPLQGTAADLIKLAMIRIARRLREEKLQSVMTLQVHDELLFDAPESELNTLQSIVKQEMENVPELKEPLKVPLVADIGIGPNWRDLK
ncbi:MAG: DNA polymerase I [Acidobacteriaceae bacterium]